MARTKIVFRVFLPIIILSVLIFSIVFTNSASTFSGPYPPNTQYSLEQQNLLVASAVTSGELSLAEGLNISVTGSTAWPPIEGNTLSYYFKLKNIGGDSLSLDDYGILGSCTDVGEMSAYAGSSVELGAGEFVVFSGSFSTELAVGSCTFNVKVKQEGSWRVFGGQETFDVQPEKVSSEEPWGVILDQDLNINVVNDSYWPPYEGDTISVSFKIQNSMGVSVFLDNYGVQGVCGGVNSWSVFANQTLYLDPMQKQSFTSNIPTPLITSNCSFIVKYEDETGWHTLGGYVEFNVLEPTPTPSPEIPGELSLLIPLDIEVKNETYWPPVAGDQLTAYFKFKNVGGLTLYLDNYGVDGTCNGEDWDLLANLTMTLDPDEYQAFSGNFVGTLPVGTCEFVVKYQDDGGWHTIGDTTSFTVEAAPVDPTPEPGEVSLYHALDLSAKNKSYWPPVAGDYLEAYFKLKNVGGEALTLTNYGVEGTCNSVTWSLFADVSVTLEPYQYVIFDNHFPAQLEIGTCAFTVKYQDAEGWHSIGVTEDFTVSDSEPTPVPANIVLYHSLDLTVKNNEDRWPPQEGDRLKVYFKIKNDGAETAEILNYGVYGTCNGTEVWELYANESVSLPGYTYMKFDSYFSTGLNEGPCEFIIRYQDALGWHELGETVSFTVQESAPGKLEFYYTLRFWVKDNDRWPPIAGDKLVGYFKLKNTGGQAIYLENLGITGTHNGSTVVEVLKGAALTLEPGQHYIFEKVFASPMEVGNYAFVVVYKEDGTWHEMGEDVYFTVTENDESEPANLILYHDFSLTVKNNEDRWPPQEGDILIAYFKIMNTGGQSAVLENLGVSGSRDGSEEWDLFVNESITLKPGEYYIFSMKYDAPLTPGEYEFQPYYLDDGGWHSIGELIDFTIQSEETAEPTITSDLLLYSGDSGEWPPLSGDQLLAFYMLRNDTSVTLNFDKLGIFGTRADSGDWSLYHFEAVSIAPDGYWAFDRSFPDTLVPGDYSFVISYKDANGWHTLGSYVNFTVEEVEEEPVEMDPNILYLNVTGEEYWPPFIGDFVEASFLLENTSGEYHYYDEVGVYGTKDGSEQILLTHPEPVTIEAGGSWTFNAEFAEGFEAGNYLLTIYVIDDSGFQTIGDYEYFVVELTAESATPPSDDYTPEASGSPNPDETPAPTPTLDTNGGDLGGDEGILEECQDTLGGWIECNILQPLQNFFCWIKQIFDPNAVCED